MGVNYNELAKKRKEEQRKLEDVINGKMEETPKATGEKKDRTVLSLSISKTDKRALQEYALRHEKTTAAVIHEWIQQHIINA